MRVRHFLQAFLVFLVWPATVIPACGGEPIAAPALPAADGVNRTLSESGLFSVLGGTAADRSELARRSETHWKVFVRTAGVPAQWHHRIIVQLHERAKSLAPESRVVGRIFPLDKGYRFQLDVLQDEDFRWDDYRRELTKLFVLSQIIGANPNRQIHERIPPWLLLGLQELMNFRQNGIPGDFFATLQKTRQSPSLQDILKVKSLQFPDSVSSGVFSACSAALLHALLSQPNGQARFLAFLSDLGTTDQEITALLKQDFPLLRQDDAALETWWTQQLTTLGERNSYAVLSLAETETQLDAVLLVAPPPNPSAHTAAPASDKPAEQPAPAPAPKTGLFGLFRKPAGAPAANPQAPFEPVPLRLFERYLKQPWAKAVLGEKRDQLARLQSRSFPLSRTILAGYLEVINQLHDGQTKGVLEHLDRLEQERQALRLQVQGIEDHINWFSTTQIQGSSGEFDGYSRALKLLEKLDQRKRPDPISRYLDAVERELNP